MKKVEGGFKARVAACYQGLYRIIGEEGEFLAELSGKFRHEASSSSAEPVVGDDVLADLPVGEGAHAILRRVLPRKSVFVRRSAGTEHGIQVVAANVDTLFLCMALDRDFNLRRLERYLAVAWDSGAVPVVVLTKADLCVDLEGMLEAARCVAPGVEILSVSSLEEEGWRVLEAYLLPGRTVAFLGSSGVGKSTLINRLLGEELLRTRETSRGGKGRHATTTRELFLLPGGAAVIDTPGMRELGLEAADLERAFAEIAELAGGCRFRDCTHGNEPGCAVRTAVEEGRLDGERLASYLKLKKEGAYEGLESREIDRRKREEMYAGFDGVRNAREYVRSKRNRK